MVHGRKLTHQERVEEIIGRRDRKQLVADLGLGAPLSNRKVHNVRTGDEVARIITYASTNDSMDFRAPRVVFVVFDDQSWDVYVEPRKILRSDDTFTYTSRDVRLAIEAANRRGV